MDITSLSTELSQQRVEQTAAVKVQKMAMNSMQEQGAALVKMMDTTQSIIRDPQLGNNINLLA